MGVYGYCVAPAGHDPVAIRGIGEAAVVAHATSGFAVWISEIDRPEPAVDAIQEHNAVIEAAVDQAVTPVPLRFGQWADEYGVFERVIAEKASWYQERLATFAGALEFGVRVATPERRTTAQDVRPSAGESGIAYMERLRASVRGTQRQSEEAARVGSKISEIMRGAVREERTEEARTPHGLITVAHLVSRDNFDEYHKRASSLREMFPELRFLVSGPWVPYSFAS